MDAKKLPIGYWIKQVDQLLTDGIDRIQFQFGLTRSGWQVMNALSGQSSMERKELFDIMTPFSDSTTTEQILDQLQDKELIYITGDIVSLTDKGKEQHTDCFEKQKIFRQMAMNGISAEDYQTTMQTLQAIADNLKK